MSFFENTRKPVGFGGKIMVAMMNSGHSAMSRKDEIQNARKKEASCK